MYRLLEHNIQEYQSHYLLVYQLISSTDVDGEQLHVVFHEHDQFDYLDSKLDYFDLDDFQLDDRRFEHDFLNSDSIQLYFAH
ncbi:hypothetical protein DPSP01_005176 [Paraphaeosphaeria sporulosa]